MNVNHRSLITRYWQFISLAVVIGLTVTLSAGRNLTRAQDSGENDPQRMLTIPLGSTGLTIGEGIRATLTNLGNRLVNAQIRIIDSEGTVLKQEPLVLEPNQIRAVTLSRSEMGRGETSVLLRAEVEVAQMDAPHLWMTGEVINWSTGGARFTTMAGRGPVQGSNLNHNETLARDQQ